MKVLALKKKLTESGVSLDYLSERIGLSKTSLSYYNSGKIIPTAQTLANIAEALGVSVDDLYEEQSTDNMSLAEMLRISKAASALQESPTPRLNRIEKIVQELRTNESRVCDKAGLSMSTFSNARRLQSDLSNVSIERFLAAYPKVNPRWLLFGEGEMFLPQPAQTATTPEPTAAAEEQAEELPTATEEQIEELRALITSQQERIIALTQTVESQQKTIAILSKVIGGES